MVEHLPLIERSELTKRHFACRVYHSYFVYLRKHYPHIDIEALCLDAGLPYSYLLDESNWVSTVFDQRFTKRCIALTGQEDLCYRVGEQNVSKEVMGSVVHFLLKHILSLRDIYKALPKLTSVFTKVTEIHAVNSGKNFIDLKFNVVLTDLNDLEKDALKANLSNIFQNTIGHYAALPTIHGYPLASISYSETPGEFPSFDVHISFPRESAILHIPYFFVSLSFTTLVVWLAQYFIHDMQTLGFFAAWTFTVLWLGFYVVLARRAQRGLYETIQSLQELDQRYHSLEVTKQYSLNLSKAYSRFLPKEVLKLLNHKSVTEVQFGEFIEQEMTILFADLRNFTSFADSVPPRETFNFLNSHLARISPIINKHGGFIDKYLGDGVMAIFPDHAVDAVLAAIEMVKVVREYNFERQKVGQEVVNMGIGINTGKLVFGTVGYSQHMQGTVVSDSVNMAARFENLTKVYGSSVIVGGGTIQRLEERSADIKYRLLGLATVRGKEIPVHIYEVYSCYSPEEIEMMDQTKADFTQGLEALSLQEFDRAAESFSRVLQVNPADKAAQHYLSQLALREQGRVDLNVL